MREVFAHDAVVAMDEHGDRRAPGGAITLALCGDWDHEPPCPLAPHHTAAERDGGVVRLRVLFAADPNDEGEVRRRIEEALATAGVTTPNGTAVRWGLLSSGLSAVRADEGEHGRRLATQ